MIKLNSRFVISYSANNQLGNDWYFNYWSLKDHFVIKSSYKFYSGDVVELIAFDEKSNTFVFIPSKKEENENLPLFVIASNDVPVSESESYKFWYYGCELLHSRESIEHGNKIYTLALAVTEPTASVKAYCHQTKQRMSFTIDCK